VSQEKIGNERAGQGNIQPQEQVKQIALTHNSML
jgi:hypothetical protein